MPLLLVVVFQNIVMYVVYLKIRNAAFNVIEALFIILIQTFVHIVLFLAFPEHVLFTIIANVSIVLILAITANLKVKIIPLSLVYALLVVIISLLSAILASAALSVVQLLFPALDMALGRDALIGNVAMTLVYLAITFIIAYFISRQLGRYLHAKLRIFDAKLQKRLAIHLLIGAVLTLGLFFIVVFLRGVLEDTGIQILVYALTLAAVFVYLAFTIFTFTDNLHKQIKLDHNEELLNDLQAYTTSVETMATEMRAFRHDHRNLMLMFHSYIQEQNWEELQKLYSAYIGEFTTTNEAMDSCLERLGSIKTPELKSILFAKLLQAQNIRANMVIEIDKPVTITGDNNLLDACRIMGIFMDNAIEACKDEKDAEIRLMSCMDGDNTVFILQNTCLNKPPMNKICGKGFTTKESARGMGLYNVSELIRKNDCISLKTDAKGGKFTQELRIAPNE